MLKKFTPQKGKIIDAILILLIINSLATKDAKAYLDPGSSSYLIQVLFAGFFSSLLVIKTFWKKIVTLCRRIFSIKSTKPDEKSQS